MSQADAQPRAWLEWFVVREMGDELLVYDLRNQRVTSLNAFAAKVWRACDAETDTRAIADKLVRDGTAVADVRVVELTLDMLAEAGLLEGNPARPGKRAKRTGSRRDFVRRLFAGGAATTAAMLATPAVVSILAPTPADAASGGCGECPEDMPVCYSATGECVQCLIDIQCEEFNAEFCANNECWG